MIPTGGARARAGLVVGAAAILVLLLVGLLILGGSDEEPRAAGVDEETPAPGETDVDATHTVDLFFAGEGDLLYPEKRELPAGMSAEQRARAIAEAVLNGPESDDLVSSFAADVALGALDLDEDGTVYVDLRSEAPRPAVTGSRLELVALYSLVNSIVYNVEEAEALVVLWNGRQRESFAGHVDTTRPVQPQSELIANETPATALVPSSAPTSD